MSANPQLRNLLLDTASRLFAKAVTDDEGAEAKEQDGNLALDRELWAELEDNGLPTALLPEEAGGADLSWPDALAILRLAGAFALPLPLAETFVGHDLLHAAGEDLPDGPITLLLGSPRGPIRCLGGQLRGTGSFAWPEQAQVLVVGQGGGSGASDPSQQGSDGGCLLSIDDQRQLGGTNTHSLAGEPQRRVADLEVAHHFELPAGTWQRTLELAALARSVMIAGAMDRVLDLTLEHVQGREQFGRPIARFQAVQQQVAMMTGYVALAGVAAESAGLARHSAAESGETEAASFECAAAKACASELAGPVARIAHQLVAAIGFTREHDLQLFTRRLWTWRDDYGDETFWQQRIGSAALAAEQASAPNQPPGAGYWPVLCRS